MIVLEGKKLRLKQRRKQLRYMTAEELKERSEQLKAWLEWAAGEVKARELRFEYRERIRARIAKVRQEYRLVESRRLHVGQHED